DELVFRLAGEGGEPAGGDNHHPLLGLHAEPCGLALPGDGGDDRAVVLEVEVEMPRGGPRDAADLAAHPDMAELALDDAPDRARKLGDGEFGGIAPLPRAFVVLEDVHGVLVSALRRP